MSDTTLHGLTLRASVTWAVDGVDQWWTIKSIGPRLVRLEHPHHAPISVLGERLTGWVAP